MFCISYEKEISNKRQPLFVLVHLSGGSLKTLGQSLPEAILKARNNLGVRMCIATLEIFIDEVAPQYPFVSFDKTRTLRADRFLSFFQPNRNIVQSSIGASCPSQF